jgi:hypothetical protein
MKKAISLLVTLFVTFASAKAQEDSDTTARHPLRKYVVFGGTVVVMGAIHWVYTKAWWWQDRGPFHVAIDNEYALMLDKAGHFTAWNWVADGYSEVYRWAGWSKKSAAWSALGTAFLLHLWTEGHEGFSRYFGFDTYDVVAGMIGASLIVAREYWPWLYNIHSRVAFFPTNYSASDPFMNDYHGQKFWLDVRVIGSLCLSIGVNLNDPKEGVMYRQLWLSVDIDWTKVFGESVWTRTLNHVKLIFPAVRVAPKLGWSWTSWK